MGKAERRARKRENKQVGRAEREAEAKRRKQRSGAIRGGIAVFLIVAVIGVILWTGRKDAKKTAATPTTTADSCTHTAPARGSTKTYKKAPPMTIDAAKTYTATMTTSCGAITILLDAKEAPNTVNSFVFLAKEHFYDGLKFHRDVPDFVVQGGDPAGTGSGGPGYQLATEPPKDGYKAGSVAMANAGAGTTGSQFFLTWTANGAKSLGGPPYLYSILGQITKGLDVVKRMGSFGNPDDGPPTKALYIVKVTIAES
jgi:cyclophilin family peptidyl-prolyl cis-trans isomerase